ncbi:hypothetical protein CIHG_06491 [Coccidioides immitis H538.4]|uniref:Uncharacterized protein n=1 Tax=Coccidioides immitis H538.4 TaxID=396776 RepID=A0A0J8RXE0_COCIT|nr:hypothetical protein CIHG_06491 [Coccidioides immitis H538.4]
MADNNGLCISLCNPLISQVQHHSYTTFQTHSMIFVRSKPSTQQRIPLLDLDLVNRVILPFPSARNLTEQCFIASRRNHWSTLSYSCHEMKQRNHITLSSGVIWNSGMQFDHRLPGRFSNGVAGSTLSDWISKY